MIIQLSVNDSDAVSDIKATGAKEFLEIINRELNLKITKVTINEITADNIELRNMGKEYEYYRSNYEVGEQS